ncbi:hypothetical protein [Salinarchaeum sp. Harcht-Bsk1]|uniref:hypothetical protein n=1 Tax=Salinarchaeum sp. Harcht-Bsk1 TaxID=1333523 RepID=UPI0011819291|nr:hypothetical protein [Salinarchaeum sp. Harcht-Bsk1]
MAAPTFEDGLRRSTEVFLLPNIAVLIVVVLSLDIWGVIIASLLYLVAVAMSLQQLVSAANYWNTGYRYGFLMGSVFWILVFPGVLTSIINPIIGGLVVAIEIAAVAAITQK